MDSRTDQDHMGRQRAIIWSRCRLLMASQSVVTEDIPTSPTLNILRALAYYSRNRLLTVVLSSPDTYI